MKPTTNPQLSSAPVDDCVESKTENINLIYQDEYKCIEAFRKYRLQSGMHCKICDFEAFPLLCSGNQFSCKNCGHQSEIRNGSILEDVDLPFSYLFIAVHVLVKYNQTVNVSLLQEITGYTNIERFALLLDRIRVRLSLDKQLLLLICFIECSESDIEYLI